MKKAVQIGSQSIEKEVRVLNLLHPEYENYSQDKQSALHYSLIWTMDALETVGLMEFVRQSDEVT